MFVVSLLSSISRFVRSLLISRMISSVIVCCLILCLFAVGSSTRAIDLVDKTVFKIDLQLYEIQTWASQPGQTASVWSQVEEMGGVAGINASYFCPNEPSYAWCGSTNMTDADRVVAWIPNSLHTETGIRWMFGFDQYGQFLFSQKRTVTDTDRRNTGNGYRKNSNRDRLGDVYYGISNFPILIDGWEIVVNQYDPELFREHLVTPWRKGFICIDAEERFVYMWFIEWVTVETLAQTIKARYDCAYAINLDAWGSTALYTHGWYLLWPWRQVPDGFVVVPKFPDLYGRKTFDGEIVGGNSEQILWYRMTPADRRIAFSLILSLREKMSKMNEQTQAKIIRQLFHVTQDESLSDNPRIIKILQTVVRALVNS